MEWKNWVNAVRSPNNEEEEREKIIYYPEPFLEFKESHSIY